jgi:hypothetical protein
MANGDHNETLTRATAKKVDAVGWGVFFMWIG